jgi:hypothetical protein
MRAKDRETGREGNEFYALEPGFEPACAHDTPARHGLKKGEQSRHHKNQPPQRIVAGNDNPGNETERADDAARHTTAKIKVRFEEPAHDGKLARNVPEAKSWFAVYWLLKQGY